MPNLQYFSVPLDGGLNTRESPFTIADNEKASLSVWDFRREGSLTNRFSSRALLTYATGQVAAYLKEVLVGTVTAPSRYLISYIPANGNVYTHADATLGTNNTLFTWTTTQRWMECDVLNGSAWFVNGNDTPQQWTGATATTVVSSVPAMPVAQYIKMYKNYCFVASTAANPSRVFFSSIKDPTTWPSNNFQDVAPNDGDAISGMYPTTEGLLIFKPRSLWMMIGDTFDSTNPQWRLVRLSGDRGGYASSAAYLAGLGVCFGSLDGIYVWDGTSIKLLSEKIQPTVDGMDFLKSGYAGANTASRREAQGTYYKGRYFLVGWKSDSQTSRDLVILDQQGRWFAITSTAAVALTNYNNALLFGTDLSNNQLIEEEITTQKGAIGAGFNPADAYSKQFDFGDPWRFKHLRRVYLLYSMDSTSATPSMTITAIPDGDTTKQVAATVTATSGTTLDLTGNERARRYEYELNFQARYVQFRFQSSATSVTNTRTLISVLRLVVEYTMESPRGGTL